MLRKCSVCLLIVLLTGCLPPRDELSQTPPAQHAAAQATS